MISSIEAEKTRTLVRLVVCLSYPVSFHNATRYVQKSNYIGIALKFKDLLSCTHTQLILKVLSIFECATTASCSLFLARKTTEFDGIISLVWMPRALRYRIDNYMGNSIIE